jgi:tetratricopeptide (TPR) repeat protein
MRGAFALGCAAILLCSDARADDAASSLLEQGHAASKEGKRSDALEAYQRSFEKAARYDTAANLGLLELELGNKSDAAKHLALALMYFPKDGDAALRGLLRQKLDELDPATVAAGEKAAQAFASPSTDAANGGTRVKSSYLGVVLSGSLLTIAAVAVGTAFTVDTVVLDNSAKERIAALQSLTGGSDCAGRQELCDEIVAFQDKRDATRIGAIVGWVAAGAFLAGTLGYGLAVSPVEQRDRVTVMPWLVPQPTAATTTLPRSSWLGGATISGRF